MIAVGPPENSGTSPTTPLKIMEKKENAFFQYMQNHGEETALARWTNHETFRLPTSLKLAAG
eukprot:12894255-Prorocentrum_lima.AAC.1